MTGSDSLNLVQILIRLAADWRSKYGDRHCDLHERVQDLGCDAFAALDENSELKREIAALNAEIELHPFRAIVRLVSPGNGNQTRGLGRSGPTRIRGAA